MKSPDTAVLDYGMGNLGSVANMVRHIGASAELVRSPSSIGDFQSIILPGVGQFGTAMDRLRDKGWVEALNEARERGAWILGICLGMQLMTRSSEESDCKGLGWFDLQTRRIPDRPEAGGRRRVPHMGWNEVRFLEKAEDLARYYFVHSYCVQEVDAASCWAVTEYEGFRFASAIRDERVWGVQFHPEKSHRFGKALLRRFLGLQTEG